MTVRRINRKQVEILKALSRYKFLTYDQIKRLGIESDKGNISKLFKYLRESKRPLVRKIPHQNGQAAKHYLTAKGKEVLIDLFDEMDENEMHFLSTILYTATQDQRHRTSIIDIQIELDLACENKGIEVLQSERYFDTVGNNRVSKNLRSKTAFLFDKRNSVKADLIFFLQTSKQKEMYVLELENGKDTKKAVEKCVNHAKAILLKSANEKYNFKRGYRTLWVFEHKSIMITTTDRLRLNPYFKNMKEYFLFKPLKEISENFFEDWINIDGQKRKIYYQ